MWSIYSFHFQHVFFPLPAFLSTEEFAQLAIQQNEPRFDMLEFRFPSYDREHSSDHVLVAPAELLINFRTHEICLSFADPDNGQFMSQMFDIFSIRNLLDVDFLLNFSDKKRRTPC